MHKILLFLFLCILKIQGEHRNFESNELEEEFNNNFLINNENSFYKKNYEMDLNDMEDYQLYLKYNRIQKRSLGNSDVKKTPVLCNITDDSPFKIIYLEQDPSKEMFIFFLGNNTKDKEIIGAELRLHRLNWNNQEKNYSPYYLFNIYQILPIQENSRYTVNIKLGAQLIPKSSLGWQVFNVSKAVEFWKKNKYSKITLLITVTSIFNEPVKVVFSRNRSHFAKNHNYNPNAPCLVIYTENKN